MQVSFGKLFFFSMKDFPQLTFRNLRCVVSWGRDQLFSTEMNLLLGNVVAMMAVLFENFIYFTLTTRNIKE